MRPPLRSRDVLLILLALTTGATDGTAFLRLGHAFASVITGNLVLLGLSAERTDGHLALVAGCALAGYAIGVLVAAPRREESGASRERGAYWPGGTSLALLIDFALLVAFAFGWELTNRHPGSSMQAVLLAVAGAAMGAQSTAVRRIGQLSTTYLTSTLTGLLEALVVRQWSDSHARSIGILCGAVLGAAAAAALVAHAAALLPLLQLLPLAIVLLVSARLIRRGQRAND